MTRTVETSYRINEQSIYLPEYDDESTLVYDQFFTGRGSLTRSYRQVPNLGTNGFDMLQPRIEGVIGIVLSEEPVLYVDVSRPEEAYLERPASLADAISFSDCELLKTLVSGIIPRVLDKKRNV